MLFLIRLLTGHSLSLSFHSNNEYCDKQSGFCINDNARSVVDCVRDNDCDNRR